jgi:general stress protein YciG
MAKSENKEKQQPGSPGPKRGLASASEETRKAVARKGGQAVSRNRTHMSSIGRKGGKSVSQDRQHMSQIGRKGGEMVSRDRQHMSQIGRKGGGNSRGGDGQIGDVEGTGPIQA